MNLSNLTSSQLNQAANLQAQIEKLQADLASVLEGAAPAAPAVTTAPAAAPVASKKGMISAAGVARIKAAQKARWAKIKAAKVASAIPAAPAVATKPAALKKPTMSPAAKELLSKKLKSYWSAKKQAKK